ncbi:MAG: hypothetical protein JXR07_20680, partial [Reichenbachiella sp.]
MRIFLGLLTISILLFVNCDDEEDWTSAPLREIKEDPEDPADTVAVDDPSEPIDWCVQDNCWDETIFMCRDSTMNANFTREESDAWTGGDATYSIPLSGNRTLWLFGDTFIG